MASLPVKFLLAYYHDTINQRIVISVMNETCEKSVVVGDYFANVKHAGKLWYIVDPYETTFENYQDVPDYHEQVNSLKKLLFLILFFIKIKSKGLYHSIIFDFLSRLFIYFIFFSSTDLFSLFPIHINLITIFQSSIIDK